MRAEFRLEEEEIRQIEAEYGAGVMPSTLVTVSKDYSNARMWDFEVDEAALVRHIVNEAGLPAEIEERTAASSTVEELLSLLKRLEIKPPVVGDLLIEVSSRFDMSLRDRIAKEYLERLLPTFVYFDDYSAMKGRISIPDLRRRSEDRDRLDDGDRTFMSLISLVGTDLDDLASPMNYEHLKAELESASINITDEVFEYWRQSPQLRVEFDLSNGRSKRTTSTGRRHHSARSHLQQPTPRLGRFRRAF